MPAFYVLMDFVILFFTNLFWSCTFFCRIRIFCQIIWIYLVGSCHVSCLCKGAKKVLSIIGFHEFVCCVGSFKAFMGHYQHLLLSNWWDSSWSFPFLHTESDQLQRDPIEVWCNPLGGLTPPTVALSAEYLRVERGIKVHLILQLEVAIQARNAYME